MWKRPRPPCRTPTGRWSGTGPSLRENFIARSDLDTAETNRLSALAQLNVAKAQVEQQKAALNQEETNLQLHPHPLAGGRDRHLPERGYRTDGGRELPDADPLQHRPGSDPHADRYQRGRGGHRQDQGRAARPVYRRCLSRTTPFPGRVAEIRNAPTTVQNVVTYNVVVKVANPELKLKPGMTANVSIITALEKGFSRSRTPPSVSNGSRRVLSAEPGRCGGAAGAGRPQAVRAANGAKTQGVWVLDGQKPRRAPLTLGISDGNETAVLSGELKEGDAVIIEATGQAKKGASQTGGPRFF